jgi:hypothetical protein
MIIQKFVHLLTGSCLHEICEHASLLTPQRKLRLKGFVALDPGSS